MKRIKVFMILGLLCAFATVKTNAQKNEILFTIADKDTVTVSEFMQMYNRNSGTAGIVTDIDDYLDLYINYKLKLLQAREIGLDKDSSTIKQVEEYKKNILKPYINDPKIMDSLVRQAYDRLHTLIRVSQILISVPDNVAPGDTMQYYQKARSVYKKALNGENFTELVDKYSDDASANPPKGVANHGDMGYFTSMLMIYPFEDACYSYIESKNSDDLGDSIVFCRTQFGYHIIKLVSVKKVDFMTMSFSHIFISTQKHSEQEAKDLIDNAYGQIAVLGFDSVAKAFSEDKFSANNGGRMYNQHPSVVPAEYIDLYMNLSDGKITQPFQTRFGWHIVRFNSSAEIPHFDMIRSEIYDRISKDERVSMGVKKFIADSKEFYGFSVDTNALKRLAGFISDSVFSATWVMPDAEDRDVKPLKKDVLFSVGKDSFYSWNFLEYIFENQTKTSPIHLQSYINTKFEEYSGTCVIDYASSHIYEQYPQLEEAVKEFENGVLIFDLTDRMVWNKSVSDSIAVRQYYEDNKSKYLYTERADAVIWTINKSLNISGLKKKILGYKKRKKSNDEIKDILNRKYSKDGKEKFAYIWGRFEYGTNRNIDKNVFADIDNIKKQNYPYGIIDTSSVTNRNLLIVVNEIMPVGIKPFESCKGLVTSDYQEVLEKSWIDDLKKQYPVVINFDLLNTLKH
ncbi:MAG: peptidylprolyl isomerase [Bacteroidales bacterium]|nr:peptidylprolyl isomerase [Bacteroidales bacterium]